MATLPQLSDHLDSLSLLLLPLVSLQVDLHAVLSAFRVDHIDEEIWVEIEDLIYIYFRPPQADDVGGHKVRVKLESKYWDGRTRVHLLRRVLLQLEAPYEDILVNDQAWQGEDALVLLVYQHFVLVNDLVLIEDLEEGQEGAQGCRPLAEYHCFQFDRR